MGGTFDPIHLGHLVLGECAREQFGLEKVLFMPNGNPPHKRNRTGRADDRQRLDMVRAAVRSNPYFECSDFEMRREGLVYTYETLALLREENPGTGYYFIIGADSLLDFEKWREPAKICSSCVLLAAVRGGVDRTALEAGMERIRREYGADIRALTYANNFDISSEMIRSRAAEGMSIRYYVPDEVADYIARNRIYRQHAD